MKRHQSLYPLSRDHHHALVEARKLRLAAETDDYRSHELAVIQFVDFWKSRLQGHFSEEEELVLPLLAQQTSPDSSEVGRTFAQHAEIASMIDELTGRLSRRDMIEPGLLKALGESLRDHIRFEESELFPAVEKAVSEEDLWRINERLTKDQSQTCSLPPISDED